jgi:transposase
MPPCITDSGNQADARGGLTSKLHVVVDGKGLPLRLGITAGQAHDNRLCSTLLSGLTPRTTVLADRGYDASWIRALVNKQGAWASPTSIAPEIAVLQQDQTLPAHRNALRQTRGELPCVRPAGLNPPLAARL